ncbi:unnamed protein product, partial [Cuscuta campestris]
VLELRIGFYENSCSDFGFCFYIPFINESA